MAMSSCPSGLMQNLGGDRWERSTAHRSVSEHSERMRPPGHPVSSTAVVDRHWPAELHTSDGGPPASFLSVRPNMSFHFVECKSDGAVTAIEDVPGAGAWINGGYFVLRHEIFDYMRPGEELVVEPFH